MCPQDFRDESKNVTSGFDNILTAEVDYLRPLGKVYLHVCFFLLMLHVQPSQKLTMVAVSIPLLLIKTKAMG